MKKAALLYNRLVPAFIDSRIAFIPMAFLLSRVGISEGLMPFGYAFFTASAGILPQRLLLAIAVLAGVITGGVSLQIYISIAGMIIFSAMFRIFTKDKAEHNRAKQSELTSKYAAMSFICVFIPLFISIAFQGFLLYDVLSMIFYTIVSTAAFFVFRGSLIAVLLKKSGKTIYNEEITYIAIFVGLVVTGLVDFSLWDLNIKSLICLTVVMMAGYRGGAGVGAGTGVMLGLIAGISSKNILLSISTFAFSGFISGAIKSKRKPLVALGVVVAGAVLALFIRDIINPLVYIKEIAASSIIFILIPRRLINTIMGFIRGDECAETNMINSSARVRNYITDRLEKFSNAFGDLSKTFEEVYGDMSTVGQQDVSVMLDRVAGRVCSGCSLRLHCWEQNFYNTYQVMFKIIEGLDSKGWIDRKDIPEYFLERCGRTAEFIDAVNNAYEIFKVEMVWKSRMSESRGAISKHYEQLSNAINGLSKEINTEVGFLGYLEREIAYKLKNKGIVVDEVTAIENNLGRYEINILHSGCRGAGNCVSVINKIVSDVSGRRMSSGNNDRCNQKSGSCMLRLLEEDNYRITTGVARIPKYGNRVSGDNFTFLNTSDGKYIVALSDGMGSGYNAAAQSKTTIGLLEGFLESGFTKDMAVSMINSILVLKTGGDETFSTMDISAIDLYSGDVEFIKTGAAPTYMKNGENVEIIKTASLPAGILRNMDTELMHRKVDENSMVILVSDGVVESFEGEITGEKALVGFIRTLDSINPQEIAEKILQESLENCQKR